MKRLALLVTLSLAASAMPLYAADVYVKTNTHTDAMTMMNQSVPARDDVVETWIDGARMATGSKDTTFIVDRDKGLAYIVNHRDRSYIETPLPFDLAKILPPEAVAMAPMMQMSATVTPTTETKTIGAWECTAYDVALTVAGMQINMRVWASTKVPFDTEAFSAKLLPVLVQAQLRVSPGSASEFAKIKGYQIATETTGEMMGAKLHATTEVVEITPKAAPAGTFEPPAGYTKKATLSLQDLQRR
jgi:hypothetical protein